MSNNYEQPVEPMSRVEDILRGDTTNVPQSRVEDLLKQLIEQGGGGGGSTVIVTQILEQGTKIASISVNGSIVDIYAPTDTGSTVSISTIQQTGTKIATLTIDDTDYDIYAPEGGGGGGNLYGTTDPTSDLGSNGDIYMKYRHRYANTSFISSTTSIPWGSTLDVTITDMDTYDGLHIEGKCMISGYGNQPFDEEWDVDDIPSDRSEAVQVTANGDCRMYRDGDTLKFYNTATSGVIDSLEGAKADAPYIIGEYGKIEGEWCNFPGYSETVLWSGSESISAWANPFTVPNVTLDILDEYDALSFEVYVTEGSDRYPFSGIILTSYVKDNYDTYLQIPIMIAHSHQMAIYPDQANNCFKMYAETNYGYIFKRLVGIKYGNGGGSGGLVTTYYTRNAQISDGNNQQLLTVQLDQPIEEGSDYVMVIKNAIDGAPVQKAFFNYLDFGDYYSTSVYGGSSIKNMDLQITSTSISCTHYDGYWQDVYIDVYRTEH